MVTIDIYKLFTSIFGTLIKEVRVPTDEFITALDNKAVVQHTLAMAILYNKCCRYLRSYYIRRNILCDIYPLL